MTEAALKPKALSKLKASYTAALDNLDFYKRLYDEMADMPERDAIGQTMAQKQSYIEAVEAILKNHEVFVLKRPISLRASDTACVVKDTEAGEYLVQEDRFYATVQEAISEIEDELTIDLLNHHLKAAELAVATIKATSLII